jgi:hypothetical protein
MPIPLIDKIKPKNNGNFPIADAEDVAFKKGRIPDYMPEAVTQAQYDALEKAGQLIETKPYLIIKEE